MNKQSYGVAPTTPPRVGLCLLLLLLSVAGVGAQLPPLTLEEATTLISSKVPAVRIESIARERCFGFLWDSDSENQLRKAGAGWEVLAVVRTTCKRLAAPTFSGSPAPPRPDLGLLRPRSAVYHIRGRPDTITQTIARRTRDGHRALHFQTTLHGSGRSSTSETVIDALSFAPVSYVLISVMKSDTARVMLKRGASSVEGFTRDYRDPAYAVRYNAHQRTLLPGMHDLLLLSMPVLAIGQRFVLPTFTASTGEPCLLSLTVERTTVVRVPAGTFPAWQVRASGSGCGPAYRIYVNKDAITDYPPRVLLATEGSGYRVELLRASLQ